MQNAKWKKGENPFSILHFAFCILHFDSGQRS